MTALAPRLLTREQAAAYCGLTPEAFDDWRRKGRVPQPIEGTRRFDRRALDLALDRLSGLPSVPAAGVEGLSALEEWRRRREAQARQHGP